jgi:hypothetical protein
VKKEVMKGYGFFKTEATEKGSTDRAASTQAAAWNEVLMR